MKLHLQYFAALREDRGLAEETIETSATNPKELYIELQKAHAFKLDFKDLKVAKGEAFCSWDTPLNEGDTITYLPPVGGG